MDLNEVKRSEVEETKTCIYCHTTRTPLWRSGPGGPKSLCNACGIKYNKKRRQLLGLDKGRSDKGKKKKKKIRKINGEMKNSNSREIGQSLKMKLMALGGKLREEEQAAILLMALSCGSIYA